MSAARERSFQTILTNIDKARLPDSHKAPLKRALLDLYEDRPNAVDKVQAPLGRALRNPLFPKIWSKCVAHIPTSDAYTDLRNAAQAISDLVDTIER